MAIPLLVLAVLFLATAVTFYLRLQSARAERDALQVRYRGVADAQKEAERIREASLQFELKARERASDAERWEAKVREEANSIQKRIVQLRDDLNVLEEAHDLQSVGYYRAHYDFESAFRYEAELLRIQGLQKEMLKNKSAAAGAVEWTVNGSKAEGRKQINQTLKLMLRAFNGEADASIAKVKWNNVQTMEARILKAAEAINALAQVQQCSIAKEYVTLRLQELWLVHEYQEKVQAEKEEQRRIREQMREEEVAQRELERARLEAEKEERRYADALDKARREANFAAGAKQEKLLMQIADLEARLAQAHAVKERAIAQAQLTRSGHVYVISNIGSFGEHVFKIGMTRRLDPLDRIRELGDASVPFEFDIHAIIYSEDAPGLENKLHKAFGSRRVNRVNERKEFFRVTIEEIADIVRQHHGEIAITMAAEARDYRQTLAMLQSEGGMALPNGPVLVGLPTLSVSQVLPA